MNRNWYIVVVEILGTQTTIAARVPLGFVVHSYGLEVRFLWSEMHSFCLCC